MSKRRNKSRFTKTDVNTICEMQRKISAYESYIIAIYGHTRPNHNGSCFIKQGTDMDEWVEMTFQNIDRMREEIRIARRNGLTKELAKTTKIAEGI